MFGDPIRNEKGWEVKKLGEILNIERGSSPRPINKYITKNILNNNSLVFLATIGNKKILYTGDIEKIAEEQIIKRIEGIHIDYLKVAHHGSRSSTTDIFLNNIKCKYFVISCRCK